VNPENLSWIGDIGCSSNKFNAVGGDVAKLFFCDFFASVGIGIHTIEFTELTVFEISTFRITSCYRFISVNMLKGASVSFVHPEVFSYSEITVSFFIIRSGHNNEKRIITISSIVNGFHYGDFVVFFLGEFYGGGDIA